MAETQTYMAPGAATAAATGAETAQPPTDLGDALQAAQRGADDAGKLLRRFTADRSALFDVDGLPRLEETRHQARLTQLLDDFDEATRGAMTAAVVAERMARAALEAIDDLGAAD